MSIPAILAPVFVQVLLTFLLLLWTGYSRYAAGRAKEVRLSEVALGERNWPPRAQKAANAFQNQFELPVLFLALVALAILTRQADLLFVVLSWLFVLTRIVHALIYVTINVVTLRFLAFLAGALILMLLWALFALDVLASGPA